jgi:hypothetical protein
MLSKKSIKAFGQGQTINCLNYLGLSSLTFNTEENRMHCNKDKAKISLNTIVFFVHSHCQFLYLAYLAARLLVKLSQRTTFPVDISIIFWLPFFSSTIFWTSFSVLFTWQNQRIIVEFFNSMLILSELSANGQNVKLSKKIASYSSLSNGFYCFLTEKFIKMRGIKEGRIDVLLILVWLLRIILLFSACCVTGMFAVKVNPHLDQFIYSAIYSTEDNHPVILHHLLAFIALEFLPN